jgi:hypothetical protein
MVQINGTPEITGDPAANTIVPTSSVDTDTLTSEQKQSLLAVVTQQLAILIEYLTGLLIKKSSLMLSKINLAASSLNATASVKTQQQTVTTSTVNETVQMLPVTARQPKTSTASQRVAKHESNLVNDALVTVDSDIKTTRSDIAKLQDLQTKLTV